MLYVCMALYLKKKWMYIKWLIGKWLKHCFGNCQLADYLKMSTCGITNAFLIFHITYVGAKKKVYDIRFCFYQSVSFVMTFPAERCHQWPIITGGCTTWFINHSVIRFGICSWDFMTCGLVVIYGYAGRRFREGTMNWLMSIMGKSQINIIRGSCVYSCNADNTINIET